MTECKKEISKEVYDRAVANHNMITDEDKKKVFSDAVLYGYGLYGTRVTEEDGKYICHYKTGDTCD